MNGPTPFLETHRFVVSTLSPVHLGSGDDYEPTNYVLDGETLYGFETATFARLLTTKQREELTQLVKRPRALSAIQSFILGLRQDIVGISTHSVTVAPAIAKKYQDRIGKVAQNEGSGNRVINTLEISRTAFNPHSCEPILPGSGLKGSIRTALLNALNGKKSRQRQKKEASSLEKELLQGSFSSDPLRLIKVSDAKLLPANGNCGTKVVFDNNLPKDKAKLGKELKSAGLSVMREVIPAMNARSFEGQLSIQHIEEFRNHNDTPNLTFSLKKLADHCNTYYRALFETEMAVLNTLDCLDRAWLALINDIFHNELKTLMSEGKALLLRVGRHTSAEVITIEGARSIEIPQRKDETRYGNKTATTLWLAGDQEKSKTDLQPFGWIVLEIGPQSDDKVSQSLASKLRSFNHLRWENEQLRKVAIASVRAQVVQRNEEALSKIAAERARKEAQERMEAEKIAAIANMSEEVREVMKLRERMLKGEGKNSGAGCALASDAAKLTEKAISWPESDKALLRSLLVDLGQHLGIDFKKHDKWKARIRSLAQ